MKPLAHGPGQRFSHRGGGWHWQALVVGKTSGNFTQLWTPPLCRLSTNWFVSSVSFFPPPVSPGSGKRIILLSAKPLHFWRWRCLSLKSCIAGTRSVQKGSSHVLWKMETFIEEDTRNIVHRTMTPQFPSGWHLGISHSCPNHHHLPVIFSWISSMV